MYRCLVDLHFLPSNIFRLAFPVVWRNFLLGQGKRHLQKPVQGLNLLYIGGLVPHYGLKTLVKAVSDISDYFYSLLPKSRADAFMMMFLHFVRRFTVTQKHIYEIDFVVRRVRTSPLAPVQ